jgi:hypothetical protein
MNVLTITCLPEKVAVWLLDFARCGILVLRSGEGGEGWGGRKTEGRGYSPEQVLECQLDRDQLLWRSVAQEMREQLICFLIAASYVCSLYLIPASIRTLPRDHLTHVSGVI